MKRPQGVWWEAAVRRHTNQPRMMVILKVPYEEFAYSHLLFRYTPHKEFSDIERLSIIVCSPTGACYPVALAQKAWDWYGPFVVKLLESGRQPKRDMHFWGNHKIKRAGEAHLDACLVKALKEGYR